MNTITVKDFAKEKGMLPVTVYKIIANRGIEPVGIAQGRTKYFNLYSKDALERICVKRSAGQPKKQNTFNVSKLW